MLVGFKLYKTQSLAASGAAAGINVGPERAQLETEFRQCVRRSGDRVRSFGSEPGRHRKGNTVVRKISNALDLTRLKLVQCQATYP